MVESFGRLECFVSGNAYVNELLKNDYLIVKPEEIEPACVATGVKASMVRFRMAKGEDWQSLMPECVAHYMGENGLDERLRLEFGAEIISRYDGTYRQENAVEEKRNVKNIR